MIRYYAACDVFVLPTPKHPATQIVSPTKFAEYVAMGKPILSTDVGDPPQFIRTSECGFVVADNSIQSLIDGMGRFKGMTKSGLIEMGARSRKLAEENFDWNKIGSQLVEALQAYE